MHIGLLVLRLGIGISFFFHGLPKIMGGPEQWEILGKSMANLGINFAPTFWGFLAALSECLGGLLIATGILFRASSFFLAISMMVALIMHLKHGDNFKIFSHAMEAMIIFIALFISGPGSFAIRKRRRRL